MPTTTAIYLNVSPKNKRIITIHPALVFEIDKQRVLWAKAYLIRQYRLYGKQWQRCLFYKNAATAGQFKTNRGTAIEVQKAQTALDVAYWGEDNRFPQNIEQQMAYCGIGKYALNWSANALFGSE